MSRLRWPWSAWLSLSLSVVTCVAACGGGEDAPAPGGAAGSGGTAGAGGWGAAAGSSGVAEGGEASAGDADAQGDGSAGSGGGPAEAASDAETGADVLPDGACPGETGYDACSKCALGKGACCAEREACENDPGCHQAFHKQEACWAKGGGSECFDGVAASGAIGKALVTCLQGTGCAACTTPKDGGTDAPGGA